MLLFQRPWNIAKENFLLLAQKRVSQQRQGIGQADPRGFLSPRLLSTHAAWHRETTYPTIVGGRQQEELCHLRAM